MSLVAEEFDRAVGGNGKTIEPPLNAARGTIARAVAVVEQHARAADRRGDVVAVTHRPVWFGESHAPDPTKQWGERGDIQGFLRAEGEEYVAVMHRVRGSQRQGVACQQIIDRLFTGRNLTARQTLDPQLRAE